MFLGGDPPDPPFAFGDPAGGIRLKYMFLGGDPPDPPFAFGDPAGGLSSLEE